MTSGVFSRRPAPPLDGFVELLWTSERPVAAPHAREWNLPTGRADLIVPLTQPALRRFDGRDDASGRWHAGGVLQGVQEHATLRDTSTPLAVVGAQFRHGGLCAFVAAPATEFSHCALPLDVLWPGLAGALQDRLTTGGRLAPPAVRLGALEAALLRLLRPSATPDRWLAWVVQQLALDPNRVGAVQQACGCSPARFIERYRRACGLAPKRHAALMRFNALLQRIGASGGGTTTTWAEAASMAGYADQAHMNRAFRRFAGLAPGEYQRAATAFAGHAACR